MKREKIHDDEPPEVRYTRNEIENTKGIIAALHRLIEKSRVQWPLPEPVAELLEQCCTDISEWLDETS